MADHQRICSVSECGKPHYAKGLCNRHWQRQRRNGDPTIVPPRKPARRPRAKTLIWIDEVIASGGDDCVLWPFSVGGSGYGNLGTCGRYVNAHRYICEIVHGMPTEVGLEVSHSCGNKLCCNPRHLSWATHIENEALKIDHGTLPRGEQRPEAKLTVADVRRMRQMAETGLGPSEVGRRTGVSTKQAWQIIRRKRWAWLE